jgi:glycosyltransferase involved in cell wall biosynthesis
MRVLHWYANYLAGGAVASSVRGITAAQARQGACVTIAAAETLEQPLYEPLDTPPGVEVISWRPAATIQAAGQSVRFIPRRETRRLRELEPDVVHVHGEFNVDNVLVPWLFRSPVVISPHGALHPTVLRKSRRLTKRLYLAVESRAFRRPATFHALSPMEREHTTAVFPKVSVYCVPQGPNPSFGTPDTVPDSSSDSAVAFTYAFVGRLDVYTKGLDVLLDAFARAATRVRHLRPMLVLIGPDWKEGREWLELRANALGIGDRVRFTGTLSGQEVASVLGDADVYVQLSRHDGFPLSVVEALSTGKPAVLSDAIGTVSYREIAELPHIKVVPPTVDAAADALVEIAEGISDLRAAALRHRADLLRFFSWDRAASLHLEAYARLR